MTATTSNPTLHPNWRVDRITPRPVGTARRPVNYAARRTVAVVLVVVAVAIAALAASALAGTLANFGARPAAASGAAADSGAPVVRVHVAQSGDTLWSIADRYRATVSQDRFVDALIDVNGGTVIQVGQAVRLP